MPASPKPFKGTAKRQKAASKRLAATMAQLVYALVDLRDGGRCRACRAWVGLERIHRHHLRGRTFNTREDICHLCEECHSLLHVRVGGKLLKVHGNAELHGGLTVETRQNDGTWRVEAGF